MRWIIVALIAVLAGCSSSGGGSNSGRYSLKYDKAPDQKVDLSHVKDAVPRVEPKSRGGNKSPYTVFGKSYYVMPSASGYNTVGTASWYGKKFHGHKTSNGEVYDMYKMSAAHKSLPLPTYLRVTNLANNKQVIVRVNDRGPFHGERLIDLSYAAAYKLDMLRQGTARVRLEAIDPHAWQRSGGITQVASTSYGQAPVIEAVPKAVSVGGKYLQIGAYSSHYSAQMVADKLQSAIRNLVVAIRPVTSGGRVLHRVQMGPLAGHHNLTELTRIIEQLGYNTPRLVELP